MTMEADWISATDASADSRVMARLVPGVRLDLDHVSATREAPLTKQDGYGPQDGILSASTTASWRTNGFESAINFPTGSSILGS